MVSKSINKKKANENVKRELLNTFQENDIMLKSKSLTKQLTMSTTLREQ